MDDFARRHQDLTKRGLILQVELWSLTVRRLVKTRRLCRSHATLTRLLAALRDAHKELVYGSSS